MPDSFEHMSSHHHPHAQRRPHLPGRQRGSPPPGGRGRPDPRADGGCGTRWSALVREHAPDVVGLSVMTFQRRTAKRLIALAAGAAPRPPASSSGATTRASPPRPGPTARRTSSSAARARSRSASSCAPSRPDASLDGIAGLTYRDGDGYRRTPDRPVSGLEGGEVRLPDRGARVLARLHPPRPAGGRGRDVPRLHLRLQLLLDHRDARPELPHLRLRPRDRRHPGRARPGGPGDLHRGRQHHPGREALRGALPGHRGRGAPHDRVHGPGDDLGHRQLPARRWPPSCGGPASATSSSGSRTSSTRTSAS